MEKEEIDLVPTGEYQLLSNEPDFAQKEQKEEVPIQQVIVEVTTSVPVGPNPVMVKCHACKAQITTSTESKFTSTTHLSALLLCLFICYFCCCCPYCCGCFKEVRHTCPNCKNYIGSYWTH